MKSNPVSRPSFDSLLAFALVAAMTGCGGDSTPASVKLGGTISGLSTEGLVLQSGTESLAIQPAQSSFAFSTPVPAGSTYAVQVSSQPSTRDQVCTATGASGIAGSSDISSIAISCHATRWVISTLAGSGEYGPQDGSGAAASFTPPTGVAVDADGNVYVADSASHTIRRVTPAGAVTTLAGSGAAGAVDAQGAAASFNMPGRVSAGADGAVYVADTHNQKLRKISRDGIVTTLSGTGFIGATNGAASLASFYYPMGLAVAPDGNVYVADNSNQLIRKVAPDGSASTFAGSGSAGFANGTGLAASFQSPYGIAVDIGGYVYVADTLNHCIRKISPMGVVTTLVGVGSRGRADGMGEAASFTDPQGVAVDAAGNVYVADTGNSTIRKVSPSGVVTTIAGNPLATVGFGDGVGDAASFYFPFDVAVDQRGNLYVADWGNLRIRKISAQ